MGRWKLVAAVAVAIVAIAIVLHWPRPTADSTDDAALRLAQQDTAETAAAAVSDAAGLRIFSVDPLASEVYWRIYKAGLMARFGHNHVVSIGDGLEGQIGIGSDPANASWTLSFPVQGLVVDDPEIRARYGEDFESEPSEDDIAGTKRNMLSEDVLNGDTYSVIQLSGTGFSGSLDDARLDAEVELLGRTVNLTFPAAITIDGDRLTISGEYRVLHEDLGMTPFSALGGALSVGDEIDFTYTIHAVAGSR